MQVVSMGDVLNSQETDELLGISVVNDRKVVDVVLVHMFQSVVQRLIGVTGNNLLAHYLFGHRPRRNVTSMAPYVADECITQFASAIFVQLPRRRKNLIWNTV
jgi:hypothetical protein